MTPLLSVVIPTLNRPSELAETLFSISQSYPVSSSRVEFVVCDNASDSNIVLSPRIINLFQGRLRLVRFDERVGIVESFSRCVSLASGQYIHIFGDDDLAFGQVGWLILSILEHAPESSLLYLNRLIGDHLLQSVSEVAHPEDCSKGQFRIDYPTFIESYTHWPGFITSLVFSLDAWRRGLVLSRNRYPGYGFLDIVLRGGHSAGEVFVIGYPLLIQRRGIQSWKTHWPKYWLIGMSRLLSDLDSDNVTRNAFSLWVDQEVRLKNLLIDLLIARSLPDTYDRFFWSELSRTFFPTRHSITIFLIRVIPPLLARSLLRLSPNSSKYLF
jgi:glycosyltransferase involved in cell wall biosynthesis